MTDLLVSSLMADGGLEAALSQAFRKETQEMEELKVRMIFRGGVGWLSSCFMRYLYCRTDSDRNLGTNIRPKNVYRSNW